MPPEPSTTPLNNPVPEPPATSIPPPEPATPVPALPQSNPMDGLPSNIIHPTAPAPSGGFEPTNLEAPAPPPTPFQPALEHSKTFVPPTPEELAAMTDAPQPGMAAPSPQPVTGSGVVSGGKDPLKKKKFILIGAVAALALLIGGGAVFGLYLPNQPSNVWKTGLSRSGKALNMVYDKATEQNRLNSFKKSEVKLTAEYKANDGSISSNADFKFDSSNSNGTVDFSYKDGDKAEQKGSLNFMTNSVKDSLVPDIYFQVNGLKSIGADSIFPGVSTFEGKWIAIDHGFLASLYPSEEKDLSTKDSLTSADYKELAKAAIDTTTQYVLNSDKDKAVLTEKSFVKKEKTDGLNTYHYKAGINKAHAKDYCRAITDNVMGTAAFKKTPLYSKDTFDEDKKSTIKGCQDSVNEIKDTDTYDVWVDSKYKLIYKIRIYDDNKIDFTDFGQTYDGGDDIALFVKGHEDKAKTDIKFVLSLNTKTNSTKASFSYISQSSDDPVTGTFSLEATPYTGTIKADKPGATVPIQDVLKKIGIDPSEFSVLGAQDSSASSTTNEDEFYITSALEDYNSSHNGYPVLAGQINNDAWITANLPTAQLDDFRPDGQTKNSMVGIAKPAKTQYGYITYKDDGTTVCLTAPCANYKLFYLDGAGTLVTKSSLEFNPAVNEN